MINTNERADIVQLHGNDDSQIYPVTSTEAVGMKDGSGNLDDFLKKNIGLNQVAITINNKEGITEDIQIGNVTLNIEGGIIVGVTR